MTAAAAGHFWAAALGDQTPPEPQGSYMALQEQSGLNAEVQCVAHASRVHLDSRPTMSRQRSPGRRRSAVMEAPTGHRFCIIRAQTRDFDARANVWEDGA